MSVFRCKSGKYPPLLAKPLNRGGGRWSGRVAWVRWPPVKRPDKSSSRMHAALLFLPRNKSTDGPRRITLFILNRGLAEWNTRPQIFNQVSIQNWLRVFKSFFMFPEILVFCSPSVFEQLSIKWSYDAEHKYSSHDLVAMVEMPCSL